MVAPQKVSVCPLCNGNFQNGRTRYTVDDSKSVVVVRDVPARICSQCGEEWIDHSTAETLEQIVKKARTNHSEVEVVRF
jgi:YgiT-type zinc finger domain-containing protein